MQIEFLKVLYKERPFTSVLFLNRAFTGNCKNISQILTGWSGFFFSLLGENFNKDFCCSSFQRDINKRTALEKPLNRLPKTVLAYLGLYTKTTVDTHSERSSLRLHPTLVVLKEHVFFMRDCCAGKTFGHEQKGGGRRRKKGKVRFIEALTAVALLFVQL